LSGASSSSTASRSRSSSAICAHTSSRRSSMRSILARACGGSGSPSAVRIASRRSRRSRRRGL
jgi:hypothetical protein